MAAKMSMFKVKGRFLVFADVFVDADSEEQARQKIQQGIGDNAVAFDNSTGQVDHIESVEKVDE